MRKVELIRNTKETKIELKLDLDGTGKQHIDSGSGFFDHMLTLFSAHSKIDLHITCDGDIDVDYHHTVEDIGICLGQSVAKALGEKKGIRRYGSFLLPMDEALITVALDISGRGLLCEDICIKSSKVGDFDTELCKEFLMAFVREAGITLHIVQMRGENAHHIIEGIFKALARALKEAISIDPKFADEIPSTKGVL